MRDPRNHPPKYHSTTRCLYLLRPRTRYETESITTEDTRNLPSMLNRGTCIHSSHTRRCMHAAVEGRVFSHRMIQSSCPSTPNSNLTFAPLVFFLCAPGMAAIDRALYRKNATPPIALVTAQRCRRRLTRPCLSCPSSTHHVLYMSMVRTLAHGKDGDKLSEYNASCLLLNTAGPGKCRSRFVNLQTAEASVVNENSNL